MIETIKKNIMVTVAVVFVVLIIVFAINYTGGFSFSDSSFSEKENANNVFVIGGKQIITIKAKGGFSPEHTIAKAGIPTILRIETEGTFDCSSIIRIPSMDITKSLPLFGSTDINIEIQKVGNFYGTCGTGAYSFDIKFE